MKRKKCKICKKEFDQYNSLQNKCIKCLIEQVKEKKKINHEKLKNFLLPDKLQKEADRKFQIAGKILYPKSIVSGKPTEVIHHWIYKSHSNNLRYYFPNGVPLTNDEHGAIHGKRPEQIKNQIFIQMGVPWAEDLDNKSKVIRKLTEEYYRAKIAEFDKVINGL